ncbi:hypothetical protein C3L33_13200, partial [Rhododendron williamsianum]
MEVPTNDCCSICHGNFHVPCQANCSHWFCGSSNYTPYPFVFPFENEIKYNCPGKWQIPRSASINVYLVCFGASPYSGNCILQVWNYGSAFQPCSCPLCRRQINLLIPTDAASQQRNNSEVAEVLGKIERYNRHFGARSNGLIQYANELNDILFSNADSTVVVSSYVLFCDNVEPSKIIQFFCSRTIILMLVLESCILPSKPLLLSWNLFICNPMKLYNSDFYKLRMQQISKLMHDFFLQRFRDLPFLLRRLSRDILDPQRSLPFVIRTRVYLSMFLSAIYILSPVDIIPEGIVGVIGLLDDALIALICFLHIATLYRSVLVFRHGGS